MFIEKKTNAKKIGMALGFLISYILFTSILFLIMSAGKGGIKYLTIAMLVTAGILGSGALMRKWLK